jgi:uncharacterized membrane protein YbhN (UPF0104 family)
MIRKHAFQFIILLLAGMLLIWLSLRSINYDDLSAQIARGNYLLCIPVFLVSLCGHIFRVQRWSLLFHSLGEQPRKSMLFVALNTGYLVSFAIPRLGEVSRCAALVRTDNIPFARSLITVIAERLIDTLCLFILVAIAFTSHAANAGGFFRENIFEPVVNMLGGMSTVFVIAAGILLLLVAGFFVLSCYRHSIASKITHAVTDSVKQLFNMPRKGWFFVLTVLIWVCYFLMTYLWVFMFPESASLTMHQAFLIMTMGSIARSIPIQGGGMGAYHFLVSHTVTIFGLSLVTGNALAIIIHGAQAVITIILGVTCYVWFLAESRRQKNEAQSTQPA